MRLFKTEIKILQDLAEHGYVLVRESDTMRYKAAIRRLYWADIIKGTKPVFERGVETQVYVFGLF